MIGQGPPSRADLTRATPEELAALAEAAIDALARSGDLAAFGHLLRLTRVTGEAVGTAGPARSRRRRPAVAVDREVGVVG